MNDTITDEIIKEWELEGLPKDKQMEMADRIGKMMYQALLVRALDILSEKEQEEFDALLDEDGTTPQDVMKFLASKIPTFDRLVEDEKSQLKQILLIPTG